jgi:tetratricopeptide (TPR) repeat protein
MARVSAIAVLLLCLAAAAPALSEGAKDAPARSGPSVVDLIAKGQYDRARDQTRTITEGKRDADVQRLFVEGLIFVHKGEDENAIAVFEQIVRFRPAFRLARVQIAQAYARRGNYDLARAQLSDLAQQSQNPVERSAFARYAELARQAEITKRGYDYSIYFTIAPSTNLNRGAGGDTILLGNREFVIDENSRSNSGVGVAFGGAYTRSFKLGQGSLNWRSSLDGKLYGNEDYNLFVFGQSLMYTQSFGRTIMSIGPVADVKTYGDEYYNTRVGGRLDVLHQIDKSWSALTSTSLLHQSYGLGREHLDGWIGSFDAIARYQFNPLTFVAFGGGVTRETTEEDRLDHTDLRASVVVGHKFGNGLYLEGKPNYEYHIYDGDFFAPFIGPREDHRVGAAVSTSFDRLSWKGFTPVLSYEYSYQFSNVDFYEYDSHDVSLNVRRVF